MPAPPLVSAVPETMAVIVPVTPELTVTMPSAPMARMPVVPVMPLLPLNKRAPLVSVRVTPLPMARSPPFTMRELMASVLPAEVADVT